MGRHSTEEHTSASHRTNGGWCQSQYSDRQTVAYCIHIMFLLCFCWCSTDGVVCWGGGCAMYIGVPHISFTHTIVVATLHQLVFYYTTNCMLCACVCWPPSRAITCYLMISNRCFEMISWLLLLLAVLRWRCVMCGLMGGGRRLCLSCHFNARASREPRR